jgi:membrane fusion protein (multidrug efflux system)
MTRRNGIGKHFLNKKHQCIKNNQMKKILAIFAVTVLLASCGANGSKEEPTDLEGMKSLLITKEKELGQLESDIESLRIKIQEMDPSFKEKEIPVVELAPIEKGTFNHYVEVQGLVQAGEERMVSGEMMGKITSLRVKDGDRVRKGQLLATIDTETIEKSIAEIKKSLELANDVYERQKRLWEKKIGSEIQYLQAKNNKERLEKSLATIQTSLDKAKIYAPISGTVSQLMAEQGEMASPGVPLMKLINTYRVKVNGDVPEAYVQNVAKNDYVQVKIPVLDLETRAKVTRIGSTINSNNRTFEVEVRLPNPKGDLKPNLLAILMINDYTAEDVVSIPLEFVQQDVSGQSYVFKIVEEDGKYYVNKQIIETGMTYQSKVEVMEGLSGEERIVSTGAQYLGDGQEIEIKS